MTAAEHARPDVPAWLHAATLRWAARQLQDDAERHTASPDPELWKVGAERYAAAARLCEWAAAAWAAADENAEAPR